MAENVQILNINDLLFENISSCCFVVLEIKLFTKIFIR